MIWLSKKVVIKNIILTLNIRNLEFVGVFEFIVRDKRIVKLHKSDGAKFCLYLSTETGNYGSTITVSRKKYNQARLGKIYGNCSVIRNIKHADFILITENTNSDTAIKQVVLKSWANMFFIMLVLGLVLATVLFFLLSVL